MNVDRRKWKVGGKQKLEEANKKLGELRDEMGGDGRYKDIFDGLVSKVEKVKLEGISEVD